MHQTSTPKYYVIGVVRIGHQTIKGVYEMTRILSDFEWFLFSKAYVPKNRKCKPKPHPPKPHPCPPGPPGPHGELNL